MSSKRKLLVQKSTICILWVTLDTRTIFYGLFFFTDLLASKLKFYFLILFNPTAKFQKWNPGRLSNGEWQRKRSNGDNTIILVGNWCCGWLWDIEIRRLLERTKQYIHSNYLLILIVCCTYRYIICQIVSPTRATVKTEMYKECQNEMLDIIDMFNRWTRWLTVVVSISKQYLLPTTNYYLVIHSFDSLH